MDSDSEYDSFFPPLPDLSSLSDAEILPNCQAPRRPIQLPGTPRENALSTEKEPDLQKIQPCAPRTKQHVLSYQNLHRERVQSTNSLKKRYSSTATREAMTHETHSRCDGKVPKWYQLDAGEAFFLGLNVILVSATGSGKTLAFLESLLADKTGRSQLIIISPLNELEYDMV
jgi:hypothetical protein